MTFQFKPQASSELQNLFQLYDDNRLALARKKRISVITGQACPQETQIVEIPLLISGELFAARTINLPVEILGVAGRSKSDLESSSNKLEVDSLNMEPNGDLTIKFTGRILKPKIRLANEEVNSKNNTGLFEIDEALSLAVKDADDGSDGLNQLIDSFSLTAIKDASI